LTARPIQVPFTWRAERLAHVGDEKPIAGADVLPGADHERLPDRIDSLNWQQRVDPAEIWKNEDLGTLPVGELGPGARRHLDSIATDGSAGRNEQPSPRARINIVSMRVSRANGEAGANSQRPKIPAPLGHVRQHRRP